MPAQAMTSLFVVDNVKVDVTADSALNAKKQAFEEAQITAFEVMLERMLSEEERAQLGPVVVSEIAPLIKDFEIKEEKLSRVRYIANYTFRFKEATTRQYFTNLGFGFSDVRSKPILVLPLYRRNFDTILWSYDNEWLRAWNRSGDINGLVPIAVPIGDLDDVRDIGGDEALTYTREAMQRMLGRYQAGEAVILIAIPEKELDEFGSNAAMASGALDIQIFRTDRGTPEFATEITVQAQPGETRDELFNRAVLDAYRALQRDWKAKSRVALNEDNQILARVPIGNIKEWADTQKAISEISAINEMIVKKLSSKEAIVDIRFQGRASRLQAVMRDNGLTLKEGNFDLGSRMTFDGAGTMPIYELYLNRYARGG